MKYKKLPQTDIEISLICLGTMTWGEQNTEKDAHEQLDLAIDYGVNFIDTAELYPVPPKSETYTLTETYIGNWLAGKKNRDKLVIATKITGKSAGLNWIRNGNNCFNKENINKAVEASLKRLQTDYIDLYQLHWPDRKTNFFGQLGYTPVENDDSVPVEETLSILDELVKAGKIRYIGLSNETPWGAMEFIRLAREKNYQSIITIQNPYSLLNRIYEVGLAEVSHREEVGLMAYSPLAFGVLTGKYLDNNFPEGSRLKLFAAHFKRYLNDKSLAATKRYVELAKANDISPTQMALSFVNARPFVASNIIGATSLEQLKENIESIDIQLSKPVLKEIEKIHLDIPNPCP